MGRSEKKIKSERINALKKKYDAYLEEDKKRKERNDYILQKFDQMRTCSALVQVRQKPSVVDDLRKPAHYNFPKDTLENHESFSSPMVIDHPIPSTNHTYFPLETPSKVMEETIILQEISKKYILIPKSRSVLNNSYLLNVKPEKDENNDWKSKYDILEQLKNNEKENSENSTCLPEKGKNNENHDNISKIEAKVDDEPHLNSSKQFRNNTQNNYYKDEVSDEKIKMTNPEQKADIEVNNQVYQYDHFDNVVNDDKAMKDFSNYENISVPRENIGTERSSSYSEQNPLEFYPVEGIENSGIQNECISINDMPETQEKYIKKIINNPSVEHVDHYNLNFEDEAAVEAIDTNEFVKEINNDMVQQNKPITTEELEYPIEIINAQDFTPPDDVHVEDGVNVNVDQPEMKTSEDNSYYNMDPLFACADNNNEKSNNNFDPIIVTEDSVLSETAGVETFAENYYDEQSTDNFAYDQGEIVENYNTEYQEHNQNYNQEEYTAYYENAHTEQPYAIETNENEAALQQYDQTYQEQYDADYNNPEHYQQGYEQQYEEQAYVQNQYTEEQQQQHEEETPQLETMQYNNQGDAPQYVEQVLDQEEGYVEKQNEPIEISGIEKSLNQQLSPNATEQKM